MFQSFTCEYHALDSQSRLKALRQAMQQNGVDGWLLSRTDEYKGEYLAPYAERLAWLCAFTGSAGQAVIGKAKAALFVDGRYTAQAHQQVDDGLFDIESLKQDVLIDWIITHFHKGAKLGFNPFIWSEAQMISLNKALKTHDITLIPMEDMIDSIWQDQPSIPLHPAFLHPIEHAGESVASKMARLQDKLALEGVDYLFCSACDNVAWLFNIRGKDIPHNPIVQAQAIIPQKGKAMLFIAPQKYQGEVFAMLQEWVVPFAPETLLSHITHIGPDKVFSLDPMQVSHGIFEHIRHAKGSIKQQQNPIILMQAIKNEVEIKGHKQAQIYDAHAMQRFFDWFEHQVENEMTISEISAAQKLEECRAQSNALQDISFDTISAFAGNGAIIHYRVTEDSNQIMKGNGLYLVDSGGQYYEGTTDITRVLPIGKPSQDMIKAYSLVLKGHIALATAIFPKGTNGAQLDCLARIALWQEGWDYAHGTGHGIGSYLNVHEGPQSISPLSKTPLEAGMIISNEPGYYRENAFGIRLENLLLVVEKNHPDYEKEMLAFETLTYVPFSHHLIDLTLFTEFEKKWLENYHEACHNILL